MRFLCEPLGLASQQPGLVPPILTNPQQGQIDQDAGQAVSIIEFTLEGQGFIKVSLGHFKSLQSSVHRPQVVQADTDAVPVTQRPIDRQTLVVNSKCFTVALQALQGGTQIV